MLIEPGQGAPRSIGLEIDVKPIHWAMNNIQAMAIAVDRNVPLCDFVSRSEPEIDTNCVRYRSGR